MLHDACDKIGQIRQGWPAGACKLGGDGGKPRSRDYAEGKSKQMNKEKDTECQDQVIGTAEEVQRFRLESKTYSCFIQYKDICWR